MTILLISGEAGAKKFACESTKGQSPYTIAAMPGHDHGCYAPAEGEVVKRFGAYLSPFDGADDDDGEGKPDSLGVPRWVAYEMRGLEENAAGAYEEPDISIERSNDWYKAPDLSFLWIGRPEVTKKRIDNSYDGIGKIWNRGHLAMADHAQRISWQASCNTHFS